MQFLCLYIVLVLIAQDQAFKPVNRNGMSLGVSASQRKKEGQVGAGIHCFSPIESSRFLSIASLLPSVARADEGGAIGTFGGSNLSLYFTLALYVLTLPGLYSLVTRSVKTKPTQKVYDIPGPANPSAKPLRQTAAEVMAYFKSMNYEVVAAEEVITFRGVVGRSNSQSFFLTFCTFMGLGSLGLVLQTLSPDIIGGKAYFLTLLSPYAGFFYWKNAQRTDEVKVKIETSDDDQVTSIIAEGGKEDLERFSKTLQLPERGKVYVKGLFDDFENANSSDNIGGLEPAVAGGSGVSLEVGDDVVEGEES